MDTNHTKTEGAFCVVNGHGERFFGDTRQEAHDAMLADATATARTLARFGEGFLPADVAEALPALPDGYEYLVLERLRLDPSGYDAGYGDETYVRVGYEWRTFAVRRVPEGPEGDEATAWHSGTRRDDHVSGNVGRGPAVLHISDAAFEGDRIALFPDSLEHVDGAWVPCAAIELPFGDRFGNPLPALPDGYGIAILVDNGHEEPWLTVFAMPLGEHPVWWMDETDTVVHFATAFVTAEPTRVVTDGEGFDYGAPILPAGTMWLREGTWVAYAHDVPDNGHRWNYDHRDA